MSTKPAIGRHLIVDCHCQSAAMDFFLVFRFVWLVVGYLFVSVLKNELPLRFLLKTLKRESVVNTSE